MIIHRDLKPENILLAGDTASRVNGWQRLLTLAAPEVSKRRQPQHGWNPLLCCPEIILCEEYDEQLMYSFGVVLYEMIAHEQGGVHKVLWGGFPLL